MFIESGNLLKKHVNCYFMPKYYFTLIPKIYKNFKPTILLPRVNKSLWSCTNVLLDKLKETYTFEVFLSE